MFDFRYHLASLVAVVVMLGVGLLLGSALATRTIDPVSLKKSVKDLNARLNELQQTNQQLSQSDARDHDFAAALSAASTKGALAGRTVAVLVNDGRSDGLSAVTAAVQGAGGKVAVVHVAQQGFGLSADSDLAARVGVAVGSASDTASADATQIALTAGRRLATEWTGSGIATGTVSQILIHAGKVSVPDVAAGSEITDVVLVASWAGSTDPALVELTRQAMAAGLPGVGVEATSAKTGVVEAASAAGLSTVDDVDTPGGAYSLVQVLAGRVKGRFGTGPTAEHAFPQPAASQ